jgi:hypothetical protein
VRIDIIIHVMQMGFGRGVRQWLIVAGCALVLFCASLVAAIYALQPTLHQILRQGVEAYLQSQFRSTVQFSDFYVALFPRLRLTIEGVVMRHEGRTDIPALIEIRKMTVDAGPEAFWGPRHEISRVRLEGLQIHTPPRIPGGSHIIHGTTTDLARKYPFVIDEIDADNAQIVLLRKPADAATPPNKFEIHHVVLNGFGFNRAAAFHALLTNPKPRGEIDCDGQFGPWNAENPSQTPVHGTYSFRDADLATFKGIEGILSSQGSYSGPLDYLSVEGVTDTPDFALRTSDHPMALHTDFKAVVDGTNGNTILTNVTARFLHTIVETHGAVVDVYPEIKGRTIVLDATVSRGRVEDLLTLAVRSDRPFMTGWTHLKTKILIPEGYQDVVDRLQLDGQFDLGDVLFASSTTQEKVDTLSRKGQGKPKDTDISDAVSDFQGRFAMSQAEVRFSTLKFRVQGASISLGGLYNLDNGQLDFRGNLQMDAKLSQTMTGWKSTVLKPFDHFFAGQNGGSRIPIKITGTRENPSFATAFHDKENPKHPATENPPSRN